jgi:Tfp pilus assembly protein PilV
METAKSYSEKIAKQAGLTLVETMIAMTVMMVIALAVAAVYVHAVKMNSGNAGRAQALEIAQQRLEEVRSARFAAGVMDSILEGGQKTPEVFNGKDANQYRVEMSVDDDPFTAGVQVNNSTTIKEITITVSSFSVKGDTWARAYPVRIITLRSRTN